jgi:hypothetical protein
VKKVLGLLLWWGSPSMAKLTSAAKAVSVMGYMARLKPCPFEGGSQWPDMSRDGGTCHKAHSTTKRFVPFEHFVD